MRELEGYGQAIVPHVTEFQDCKDGLIIEFYNDVKELVHTYKDEGNKLGVRIKIFDTPKEVAIWALVGLSEDNWWQQYAPGLGDATAHAPDQHYVPQSRMSILCTGRLADDAMCEYLADVFHNKQKKSHNSAVFVGAGVLGGYIMDRQTRPEVMPEDSISHRVPLGGGRPKNCPCCCKVGNSSYR